MSSNEVTNFILLIEFNFPRVAIKMLSAFLDSLFNLNNKNNKIIRVVFRNNKNYSGRKSFKSFKTLSSGIVLKDIFSIDFN